MAKILNTRAAAAKLAWQIIDNGHSLDAATAHYFENTDLSPQDRGFIQELVYGVCRWYGELDSISIQLLRSPIRNKDRVIHFVLLIGLYQLKHMDTAPHAAVGETVSACKQLNKVWAKNLINGCLRTYLRTEPTLSNSAEQLSHPDWIHNEIASAWPDHCAQILSANNQRPPMCIRVNRRQHPRDDYLSLLESKEIYAKADQNSSDGIILDRAVPVFSLPGFESGACSVQDTAAQLAVDLLQIEPNMVILDACAAPGGKTAHILERTDNNLKLDALDISERRCQQLHATLDRLQLNANIQVADASITTQWDTPASGYDRILIDAPCSGLGVIRRHPDIKHHRRPSDIDQLNKIQQSLLRNLWPILKPGGLMLYMTCSVLPQENEVQAKQFVDYQNDAMLIKIDHPDALKLDVGVQTLPGVHNMDGFYYCLLRKADH